MTEGFYDPLAPYYHLLFTDWQASMDRQGAWLDGFQPRLRWPYRSPASDIVREIGRRARAELPELF